MVGLALKWVVIEPQIGQIRDFFRSDFSKLGLSNLPSLKRAVMDSKIVCLIYIVSFYKVFNPLKLNRTVSNFDKLYF